MIVITRPDTATISSDKYSLDSGCRKRLRCGIFTVQTLKSWLRLKLIPVLYFQAECGCCHFGALILQCKGVTINLL